MYIAIDGGGTKTEYLLLDERFEVVERAFGGASNHEHVPGGFEGVRREFKETIGALLARHQLTAADVKDVVAGLSGADNRGQIALLEEILHDMGFARVMVCNDGYLPVKTACEHGVGIAYNCGTGVCCTSIDSDGKMTKTGGLEEWAGDAGGGTWILQQVFRCVYDEVWLGIGHTQLTQAYMDALGLAPDAPELSPPEETLPRLLSDSAAKHCVIASLFACSRQGDASARGICDQMIARGTAYIAGAYHAGRFEGESVSVSLAGSVLLKAADEDYLSRFKAGVEAALPVSVKWTKPEFSAAYGAAQWIRERN